MDINSIRNDRAKGKVDFMGEEVRFTYRPAMITSAHFKTLTQGADEDELAELFVGIIASWDLTDDGRELPVTIENVKKLPLALFRAIAKHIVNEVPQKNLGND